MAQVAAKISKEEINALPRKAYEGTVYMIESDDQIESAVKTLRKAAVLGFDTETRPSFKKGDNFPAALLQLATETEVFLFQLLKLDNITPIWKVLNDRSIVKAGVAIADDIKKLQERQDFKPKGFVEIANLAQDCGLINTGLRSLAGLLLNFRISKGAQVSNWAKDQLSEAQIQYAATDAWVSRLLYIHFKQVEIEAIPVVEVAEEV
jgi:ribonuclease D